MLVLVTMEMLLRVKCFQRLAIPGSVRCLHKDYRKVTPQNFSDYESMKQDFKLEIPEYFNFAKDVLDQWTNIEKEKGLQTLRPLERQNQNNRRQMSSILKNTERTILIPGTPQLTQKDILYRLQSSKAKCIITNDALAPLVDAVAPKCEHLHCKLMVSKHSRDGWGNIKEMMKHVSDNHTCVRTKHNEMMAIFFTSGTTGLPKMIGHTHSSFGLGLSVNGRFWLDLTPSDVMWNTSDTGWAKSAWSSVFSPWIQGACVFAHHLPRFESTSILQTLSEFPITVFCSAPTAYRMLVQNDMTSYKFKSLKHCVSAGEPINPEVTEQWKNLTGLDIYNGYGQTETVLICGNFKGMKIKPGSMGKASPAFDVKTVISMIMLPVLQDNPSKTASTIRGNFYITGDRGYMDEDGYFWFVARSDDIILSSGYRIGPYEVESVLMEHPSVAESAVVSSPDPVRGEVVKAFIVLNPDYKSQDQEQLKVEIQEHVKKTTAPYKYPRKIEFIEELPKTISGKIKRSELRNKEWNTT
ncbi:PREDICTED: acyl-coenzyme A synthetase ACSM3, mitochondrial [Dipodomys ordii]|uniref:medium-chain acyl-CoA ligase n=1 Tax=Dipodomys ordii TaxID=10020 RepID=A0A1S3ET56_DIPOR|nr:PREDICTED: acyl-coenzyme A synthetase ACSM3, mitochondrial [Dipodomys ordii]